MLEKADTSSQKLSPKVSQKTPREYWQSEDKDMAGLVVVMVVVAEVVMEEVMEVVMEVEGAVAERVSSG